MSEKKAFGVVYQDVTRDNTLAPATKGLYAYLASLSASDGENYPSVSQIMIEMGMSREAFYKHMNILISMDIVEKQQIKACNNRLSKNIYKLVHRVYSTEKPTTEKPTTEKPTTEKPTTEKPTAEKPTAEKPTAEKPTAEKPTAEKPTTEKPTTEKIDYEKIDCEKIDCEKIDYKKVDCEKPIAEKPTAEYTDCQYYEDRNNNSIHTNGTSDNAPKASRSEINEFFERIWKLYPNKKGKGQISDAKKRKLYDIGYDEISRAVDRYKDGLLKDDWRKPQNGSTFFNSGYVDYLDANYSKPQDRQEMDAERTQAQRNRDYEENCKRLRKMLGTPRPTQPDDPFQ